MKIISLNGLDVSRIGLGAMRMSAFYTGAGSDDAESIPGDPPGLDLGVHPHRHRRGVRPLHERGAGGRAVKGRRDQVVLATKFGGGISHTGRAGLDSSPANIRLAVEGSLRRLGTDQIDLYYQHRVDPDTPIEETVEALAKLVAEGQGRPHRVVRGGAGDHPPRPRRPLGGRGPDRVLAVDPRPRGRGPAAAARAGCGSGALRSARARLPHR